MASFERYFASQITQPDFGETEATVIHTSDASVTTQSDIIIGLLLSNSGSVTATAAAYISSGSTDIYIVKDISVPVGGSIELVQGKIILNDGDALKVICTVGQVDSWLSCLDSAAA